MNLRTVLLSGSSCKIIHPILVLCTRSHNKLTTSFYQKPTFSVVYPNFNSLFSDKYLTDLVFSDCFEPIQSFLISLVFTQKLVFGKKSYQIMLFLWIEEALILKPFWIRNLLVTPCLRQFNKQSFPYICPVLAICPWSRE